MATAKYRKHITGWCLGHAVNGVLLRVDAKRRLSMGGGGVVIVEASCTRSHSVGAKAPPGKTSRTLTGPQG